MRFSSPPLALFCSVITLSAVWIPALGSGQETSKEVSATPPGGSGPARPKLVVGIAVDQMRWDFLYKYQERYGAGGFKRLVGEGFTCENGMIGHLPSYTAVGHATVFTGSVPAIHGITGNEWTDQLTGKSVYCTDDETVQTVGGTTEDGKMSPRNMLTSTVTDELRIATNFRSKVVGVSLKDRASILPAGHTATAAYWLEDLTGNFITSTYYMNDLPEWVKQFNESKVGEQLLSGEWNLLRPAEEYVQSTRDDAPWEGKFDKELAPVFPHRVSLSYKLKKDTIRTTPFGNTLSLRFAKAAVEGYNLGGGPVTDFLTINCASTDYVGHKFGPNSMEVEDTYLRLDQDLAEFFTFLDGRVGKGNYLVFLTADHGVAHTVGYMKENRLPSEGWNPRGLVRELNDYLNGRFGVEKLVAGEANYLVNFDLPKIEEKNLDFDAIKSAAVRWIRKYPGVLLAVDMENMDGAPVPEPLRTMMVNGFNAKRCGSIHVVPNPGWVTGTGKQGTTHGSWYPYDTHIPVVFMGWGIRHGSSNEVVYQHDIAPTVAALLQIQMPNGCVGKPIKAVLNKQP